MSNLINIQVETQAPKENNINIENNVSKDLLEAKHTKYNGGRNNRSPFDKKQKPIYQDRNVQKKNNKPKFNWFTQQIQQNGVDFIDKMRPQDFTNNLERIVRDIVKGKCDINQVGTYIANPIMLQNLILFSNEQYNRNEVIRNALDFTINYCSNNGITPHPLEVKLREEHRCKANIYKTCMDKFIILQQTGDPNILVALVNELNPYRYYI